MRDSFNGLFPHSLDEGIAVGSVLEDYWKEVSV
jgi:hypothetical protein